MTTEEAKQYLDTQGYFTKIEDDTLIIFLHDLKCGAYGKIYNDLVQHGYYGMFMGRLQRELR